MLQGLSFRLLLFFLVVVRGAITITIIIVRRRLLLLLLPLPLPLLFFSSYARHRRHA